MIPPGTDCSDPEQGGERGLRRAPRGARMTPPPHRAARSDANGRGHLPMAAAPSGPVRPASECTAGQCGALPHGGDWGLGMNAPDPRASWWRWLDRIGAGTRAAPRPASDEAADVAASLSTARSDAEVAVRVRAPPAWTPLSPGETELGEGDRARRLAPAALPRQRRHGRGVPGRARGWSFRAAAAVKLIAACRAPRDAFVILRARTADPRDLAASAHRAPARRRRHAGRPAVPRHGIRRGRADRRLLS